MVLVTGWDGENVLTIEGNAGAGAKAVSAHKRPIQQVRVHIRLSPWDLVPEVEYRAKA